MAALWQGQAMDFINIFITFGGRINRAKFWIAVLAYAAVLVVITAIVFLGTWTSASTLYLMVGLLAISSSGVAIKRLHDRNKSGWFALLFWFAPLILLFVGFHIGAMSDFIATTLWLIAIVIVIWSFVELGCLRGTIGQNKYGSDPLAPEVLTPPVRTHA